MSVAPTISDALAGARYEQPSGKPAKSALIAGAADRLGERVLAHMLAAPEYRRIYALASNPMASTESKLATVSMADWSFPIDDVIAIPSEEAAHPALQARKRTEVFSRLATEQIVPLARLAKAAGARRFMVVSPINVWSQPAAVYAGLANLMETELHLIGFESLVLVRPSDHESRPRPRGLARRLLSLMIDTATGLMMGLRHTPLSVDDTARAAVLAMQQCAQGLTVIETDHLHGLLKS
jgi:hypothetical protein